MIFIEYEPVFNRCAKIHIHKDGIRHAVRISAIATAPELVINVENEKGVVLSSLAVNLNPEGRYVEKPD
jgi:hypothetical protein